MEDNIQSVYNKLVSFGYKGTEDDFRNYISDDANIPSVYDKFVSNGYKGTEDDFRGFIGMPRQQQPAPRVDVSDVEAQQQPQVTAMESAELTTQQTEQAVGMPYGDLTNENFLAAKQRREELLKKKDELESRASGDARALGFASLFVKDKDRKKEYDAVVSELNSINGFIDEWNKTEGARAYYDQQKRAVDDVSARIDQMQSDRNRERLNKKREEEEKKSWWLRMAEGLAATENPITQEVVDAVTDPTNNDLRTARNEVRNAKNQLRLEEMRMNGEKRGLGIVRGLETANYYELMPAIGMADALSLLQLSQDIKNGKELTDSQKLLKEAMEARAGVDFAYQDNNTLWERIGQSTPEQLMFTLQFVIGAGVTGATKVGEKVAAKSAEKAAKRLAKKEATSAARNFVATRVVPELEGMAVSSAIQTFANPLSVAGMVEDFEKRYAGDIYYDKGGNLHVFDNDRSAGQAAYQAIASAWIENFTEYAGGNITKSAKLLDSKMFDLAGKFENVMKTVGAGKIQDVFKIPQQLGRLTQIGSAPEEFLEEELGSVMNALMMTDAQRGESYGDAFKNTISSSFAGEQQLETFLSCAITSMLLGGGGNAVNGVRNAGLRKSVNQDVEQSKALLGKVRGIDIEGLDNMIENGRVSDISAYLKEQSDANNWNKDEQGAAVSYVLNRSRQIGVKHNDDTAIEAEQAEYRRQAEDMVNRWDGQNIYNVTYTDRNGETQEGTIVNGRVHYNTNEDGTYTFDPYMSSGMLAIRRADGSVEQVAGRNVTALNNVATIEEQLESQNQTIDQLMRAEFDQDGMLPTIESVWGGNLVPNVTQFQNGRYTYLGQDDNGLYAFANNDKRTNKDNPIIYLTERQLIEYGLSLNLENAQANGDTEAAQKAQEDIDFLKRLDEITADAGAKGQWDVVKAYAQRKVLFDANGGIIPNESNEQATAAYLLAISEGSFENAIASVDQTIAALGTPQQTEVTDNAADNAAMNNAAATVDADKARQIDFYTNVRNRLTEMQQGKEEADTEEAEQVVANTPVSRMEVGTEFPVDWNGTPAVAVVESRDADGRNLVTIYAANDRDGLPLQAGIEVSAENDAEWEARRVRPQEATAPEQAPEQVEPQQEVPQAAPQQEETPQPQQQAQPQAHPLDDFIAKHGENAENKLGVTIDAINKEIASLAKDLEKAEKDLANMPEPYDEKTQKAQDKQEDKIAKLRTELDEKRNILAPYAAMQEELDKRKEVRQGRENGVTDALTKFTERLNNMLHPKREDTQDMEPQTLEEFIASKLRRKGLARTAVKTINKKTKKMVNGWKYTNPVESLDYDSFKQETGLSDSEMKNFNDPIQPFFTKEGGITFGEFVHSIWEDRGEPGVREDISDSEVRDAVIAFFRSGVSSLKDINDYIENHRRDEQAEQDAVANDMIAQHNGYESGEAMENDLIAQASARADELLGSDTLSDEDVAAFDAELSQRLDNLVPSVEETAEEAMPATQETTVENTEDEDFIQPTDEEAPFSVTGIEKEYQDKLGEIQDKIRKAAKNLQLRRLVVLNKQKAQLLQEYLDKIKTDDVTVLDEDTYIEVLRANGVSERSVAIIQAKHEETMRKNQLMGGFYVRGKIFVFANDILSIEHARRTYIHERQHSITAKDVSLLREVVAETSRDELAGYVRALSESDSYDNKSHDVLADEFISMAMEEAYSTDDVEAALRAKGVNNEQLINTIKSLDNEQQTSDGLAKARRGGGRNLHVDNNAERGSRHDGQNQGRRPGEVEEQGLRPSYRGNEKTGDLDNEQRTDESLSAARRTSPVNESRQGDNGQNGGNQKRESREVGGQRSVTVQRGKQTAESGESIEPSSDATRFSIEGNENRIFVPTSDVPRNELAVAYQEAFKARSRGNKRRNIRVFSANYAHYFRGNDHVGAVQIEGNQDLINEIGDGTNSTTARFDRLPEIIGNREGRYNSNNASVSEKSRANGQNAGLSNRQSSKRKESNRRRGNGENVSDNRDGTITPNAESNEDLRFSTNGTHVISNGKSLVGIHNIGAEKLRKAMKNGGFANPSAAVIDIDKQEHKGYGEVSLIMPSSLVDSRTGRNAGTYAGDAYTPEYPSVSYREGKNTDKLVKDLVKDLPEELGWAIRQGIGEYMDGNRSRSGLEYLFLKEKGQEMPIVKNERRYPDISTEQIDKRLGVEESATRGHSGELYAAYEKLEGDDLVNFNMWFEAYGDEEKIKQRKDLMERNAKVKEMLEEQFGEHMGYGKFDTTWYNIFRDERDAGNENISRTLEDAAIEIDNQGLRSEFEQWKQNTIDGLGYEEVIFDGYTPSGYRRYVPNTVENASRIMNKKEKTNWLSDAGTHATKAMLLDKFNTLNDIRKNRGLLESDQEVINQAYEEASDAWSELGSELADMQKVDDNRFINHDIALNRLQEAMMKSNPAAYLNKEYKYNLDEAFNDRIKEVKQQIKSLPSKYFETKFRRPVYLNEFAAAVVPNDLPQDLKERLQQSGLPLFEYDPNKEGDRRAVTLEATEGDGIRFSVANRNQAIFVSNAARAVEGIKQEKATPEQWLKMIEKNGGLKAGEDKWLGLSQWLKDQANTDAPRSDESLTEWAERNRKKTLTKQEVLDFINENAIKIEETHYGNRLSADSEAMQPWQEEFREEIENAEMLYDDADNRLEEFYSDMEDKYGADYLDQMDEDELAMEERLLQEREDVNTDYRPAYQIAFDAMVDDHGDDFGLAFYPTPNGLQISDEDAASYFLGGNQINSVRMQYTTEGLDNKREIALTVPTIEPWNENDEIHFGDAGEGRAVAWIRFGETTVDEGVKEYREALDNYGSYRSELMKKYHYTDIDSYMNDEERAELERLNGETKKAAKNANKRRVLVIDEIQSKRHQEGREKGYNDPNAKVLLDKFGEAFDKWKDYRDRLAAKYNIDTYKLFYTDRQDVLSEDEKERDKELADAMETARAKHDNYLKEHNLPINEQGIPAAPFEKNWMELAMKRMLRLAAEEGYDKVAWTTGEQQAERYNLGKFYDTIGREDKDDNYRRYVLSGNNVDEIVIDEQNRVVESSVSEAEGKPLSEVVGMDMAVKMENMNDGDELSGNDLRIGGEGMKGFYDKMIPSFMNKYGKQWGVKVGEVTMPNLEEGYQTMHSIDVNEQMKADVMEGQVMFSVKNSQKDADDNQLSLFLQNNTGEYETQDGQTIGFTSLLGAATEADAVRGRDNVRLGDDILSYHLRRLEPGETCHVERRYQKSKMFDFTGSEKIESADDVAYIFNKLEDAAVENSFIVLVKDGKPTIIHTGVGSYGSTYVNLASALVAYKNIDPDEVWFVHNHPSGSITSSQPDRDSSKKFEKVFGKKYKGGIIIDTTSGKYGVFDSKSDTESGSTRNTPSNETDIDVYEFSKQVFDKDWNPETSFRARTNKDIAAFVSSHRLGEHDKMSLLVLNNNGNIVGNVFLPYTSIGEADIKKLADDALYYMNQMAGTNVVVYGSFTADDERAIKTLAKNIDNADGRLIDVISTNSEYTGLRSAKLMGAIKEDVQELNEDEARFSVNGQQRIAVADEFNRRTGANMEDVGTYTRVKESLIRDWFDGLHPLEQAQKLIEEKLGRKLRDSEKAYELATQTTSVSAAMIDEEEKKHIIPILNKATELIRKMMDNDRLSREEAYRRLSNYMLAKHGLERNKWFHEQALLTDPNAEEEDKSGLTGLAALLGENPDEYKAVAERIVKEFEDEYDSQEIDDYWNEMRGLTNRLLEISYESGMIDKDTYDNLKKRHKFYVPLRGFGEGTIGDIFDYIGQMPHFQETLKKAKGRKSVAGDPLANLYNMLQSAIVIGNQNKVMQKLYNIAVNSNNDLLRLKKTWYVYDDVEDRWVERYPDIPKDATDAEIDAIVKKFDADMQKAKANGKAKTKLNKLDLAKKVLPYQAKQHEMVAYIDGKKVILQVVGNPVLAQALNKANKQQLGVVAEAMQGITRFMSMINTSLSPAFMLTNSSRDIGFTLFSAMVTGGFKKTGQMAAWMATSGWVIPRLMITGKLDAGLVKALGKQNAAQIEQWWNEFTQNGGETGFTRTLSAEKARGQVDDMIRHMLNGSKDGESRLKKATYDVVESAGRWSEDISRFAAYCWSRSQGNSVMESVNEAKNVTVNFNVKGGGALAAWCRAVYSFFNAALQGIGRMARLAKENPKAFAACLTACMLQGAVLPWLNMLMFGLLGGDDDDWEKYKMLTEYTANKNMVLYVGDLNPFKKTQGKFLKIPYSQELAPFAAMGNIFFRQQMGWNKGESVASQVGKMFLDLAPVSIGESKTFKGKLAKTVTPTAAKWFTELLLNEDFTGSPIQKENAWNKYARGWEKAYEGKTSKWLVDASKWLDDKTGIDISPAVAEHMFTSVLGGIGRSGDKLLRFFSNGFQLQDFPLLRTLMFDSKQQGYVGAVQREYGRNAYDVLDKVKHDVENMDTMEFARFSQTEEFEIANLVSIYKTGKDLAGNKKDVVGIDKMEKDYKKLAGMSDGSEEYREHLEAIKADITERKMEMLDEIEQIKYEHSGDLRKRIIDRVNEVERESKEKYNRRNTE